MTGRVLSREDYRLQIHHPFGKFRWRLLLAFGVNVVLWGGIAVWLWGIGR